MKFGGPLLAILAQLRDFRQPMPVLTLACPAMLAGYRAVSRKPTVGAQGPTGSNCRDGCATQFRLERAMYTNTNVFCRLPASHNPTVETQDLASLVLPESSRSRISAKS